MMQLNVIAPCNVLGYGAASLNIIRELSYPLRLAYWPLGNVDYPLNEKDAGIIQSAINNQATFDVDAPCLRIWHQFDMAQFVGRGKHVGFPIFELDKFSDREKHHLKTLDKILVCSNWAKEVVHNELGNDVSCSVVPLGVDRTIFYDTPANTSGPTIFLNVGKWEIRKGHDILLECFTRAFSEADNVELWMMNHNPFLNEAQHAEWHQYYKNSPLGNKIKFLPRVKTQGDLADLMRRADCGVFPARAEGWNLEALEMLACGRHIVVSDYSAHKDFCLTENASLVKIDGMEDAVDGIWFNGQGRWATLGESFINSFAEKMREFHLFKKGSPLLSYNAAGVETARKFSWQNTAGKVIDSIYE